MRTRGPPRSGGLLSGEYDNKHGGKKARRRRQELLKLTAAALLLVCSLLVWRSGSRSSSSESSDQSPSPPGDVGTAVHEEAEDPAGATEKERERKRNRHTRKSRPDRKPVCTASPLESQEAFPPYGCEDIEIMLGGRTEYLGTGYWRDVRLAEYNGEKVALKTLRLDQEESRRNRERHRWEALALDKLSEHPNIVHLLGICDCDIVTEYFPHYMDVLLLGDSEDSSKELEEIPMERVIRMALDAARGLQALHELPGGPVVHADLQPRQLLIDEDGVVKVNDLNRCRFMGRDEAGEPCPFQISKGNGVWRSPEEYEGKDLTEKIDIYSMGNIFWAMLGRDVPFERDEFYKKKVLRGERPAVDPQWHEDFVELFQHMWRRDPKQRPSAREVVERLEKMDSELPPESGSGFAAKRGGRA